MNNIALNFSQQFIFLQCSENIKIITIFGRIRIKYVFVLMTLILKAFSRFDDSNWMILITEIVWDLFSLTLSHFWMNSPQSLETGQTLREADETLNELLGCEWSKHSNLSKDYGNMKHLKWDRGTKYNLTDGAVQNVSLSGGEDPCLVISAAKAVFSYLKKKKKTKGSFPYSDDTTESTTKKG